MNARETGSLSTTSAHTYGHTSIVYKSNGSEIITGGNDSLVHVYKVNDITAEPTVITEHTEAVITLICNKEGFVSAGEDGAVIHYRNNTNSFDKYLARSTVPVRCLSYSANGTKVAVASDEDVIRLILIQDITKVVALYGHKKSVKCVAHSPVDDYLVSSDCDGDVLIWDLNHSDGVPKAVKTLNGAITKADSESNILGTIAWKPDGKQFAFPGRIFDICVYNTKEWRKVISLEDGHYDDISTLAWSPSGDYLCTAGRDKQVIIWHVEQKKILAKRDSKDVVSGIAWSPTENQLAFTDCQGQLSLWKNPIDTSGELPHPAKRQSAIDELDKLFDEDMSQLNIGDRSTSKPKNNLIDGEAEDDDIEDEGEDLEGDVEMMSDMDDFVIDDDGAGYVEGPNAAAGGQAGTTMRAATSRGPVHRLTEQPRFQPGATSFRNMDPANPSIPREGERRYLAFNMFGVVYTIFQGTHSVVSVEFHNQSNHRNFHFSDYMHYTMAAIGEEGAVFAVAGGDSKPVDDDIEDNETAKASVLHYRPLSNWAGGSEWTVYLPAGEDVESVAINNGSVIAATSAGYIRLYTIAGVQIHLFRLENIVSMVGHGSLAMFVYKLGTSFDGYQNLEFMLMDTISQDVIQKDRLPLQRNTQLTWIGFSEAMQAAMADSTGVVSVLHRQRMMGQSSWVPIFDGQAVAHAHQRTERYWPIGLMRNELMCLVIKGINKAPYFPRPPVDNMGLRMPTTHYDTEIGQLEEKHLRIHYMTLHEKAEQQAAGLEDDYDIEFSATDLEMDKALLSLIQLACKDDKLQRVLDLAYALHSGRSIDAAIKIATHHKLTTLAEKIMQIKEQKFMDNNNNAGTLRRRSLSIDDDYMSKRPRI
ncbi:WD40 repeat-like protein [Lichtheimia hyalospora FSU 10163]|nr:WD40 repeat-like protein [Lichtheimia hyalospora FSU 10163]